MVGPADARAGFDNQSWIGPVVIIDVHGEHPLQRGSPTSLEMF
jgi:hypothetical protein